MKKTLLGTTALVSAGLIAGPALASDPLAVTVGGSIVTGFYIIDHDDTAGPVSYDDTAVKLIARNIDINAEGTLDNGMVAGALAKLQLGDDEDSNKSTNSANFSEVYAYLEGGFGRVEMGGTDGAAFKMHYTSPWFVPGNGVDSPNIYNINSTSARTSTFALLTEDDNKVSFFTPRMGGFQLGVSFTPDTTQNDPNYNGFGVTAENSSIEEVFEIAANFAGDFEGVEVGVDGFYVTGDAPSGSAADPEEYGFGLNLGMAGFTLGGAWYESQDIAGGSQRLALAGDEKQVWTVGLAYGTGPWTVGVAYLDAELDSLGGSNGAENQMLQVGGGYSLGAGVDVGLDIQFITDKANAAATEVDSNSAGLVLAVSF